MSACPKPAVLARAIARGADPEIEAHLAACATCRAAWDADVRAIELARQVPVRMPAADRREELRTALLAAAERAPSSPTSAAPRRAWWIAGAAIAAAAAVALAIGLRDAGARVHAHGTIRAAAGARFVASVSPDEVVTLHDGSIAVDVTPLHAGDRFRVITADAEIEVRGTSFTVTARTGRLVDVVVRHGLVEVRPLGGPVTMLAAGESWTSTVAVGPAAAPPVGAEPPARVEKSPSVEPPPLDEAPVDEAPVDEVRDRPARRVAARAIDRRGAIDPAPAPAPPAPAPPPPVIDAAGARPPQDLAYDEAWAAMRAAQFTAAAAAFARAAFLDPAGPLAEDAGYWHAVALARAHSADARGAFRTFLDRHPRSPRAGEASVMLGWILVDAGERAEAARRFRAAIDDPSASVRDSARAGLDAVDPVDAR